MIIFLVFVMQSAAQLLFAQNLTIEVCDIEKVEGHLYVAIYNSEETFMKKPLTAFRIDVKDTSLSIPCQGLPTGTYAISLFQDENGNGKLDTAVFGIPTEKYGFSNDAQGVMGPAWCSLWRWRGCWGADCKTPLSRWRRSPGQNMPGLPEARPFLKKKPSG